MTNKDWFDSHCQRLMLVQIVEGRYAYKSEAGTIIFVFYKGKTEEQDGATVSWPYNGDKFSTVINMDMLGRLDFDKICLLVSHVKQANDKAKQLSNEIKITALTLQGDVWNSLGEKDDRYE